MIGFAIIFVMIVWFLLVEYLSRIVARNLIENSYKRFIFVIFLICITYPLPLIDEIVAKYQFENLCDEYSNIKTSKELKKGITVFLGKESPVYIKNKWVDMKIYRYVFYNVETGNYAFEYATLTASGGKLSTTLEFIQGAPPILFKGSCGPKEDTKKFVESLSLIVIDKPE